SPPAASSIPRPTWARCASCGGPATAASAPPRRGPTISPSAPSAPGVDRGERADTQGVEVRVWILLPSLALALDLDPRGRWVEDAELAVGEASLALDGGLLFPVLDGD